MKPSFPTLLLLPLACATFAVARVDDAVMDSIYQRLEGDDYAARYEARMELQDYVSQASAPGNEEEEAHLADQLIKHLERTPELTAKLWTLRQLSRISSVSTVPAFARLLDAENEELVDAARMALEDTPSHQADAALVEALIGGVNDEFRRGIIDTLSRRMTLAESSDSLDVDAFYVEGLTRSLDYDATVELQRIIDSGRYANQPWMQLATASISEDPEELRGLAETHSNRAVRNAAFARLADQKAALASDVLNATIKAEDEGASLDFLRFAMSSDNRKLSAIAIDSLPDLSVAQKTVVLGALPAKRSGSLENMLHQFLDTDNETLKLQTIEALGKVGSVKSLDSLLELLDGRDRDYQDAAADALAIIQDGRVDRQLIKAAKKGETDSRILSLKALSVRASKGAADLINGIAADEKLDVDLRREAVTAIEQVGDTNSLPILINIITNTDDSRLKRDAQKTIKRASLRLADPDATWAAFKTGFETVKGDAEKESDLLLVVDSAPTKEALDFLLEKWDDGDDAVRKTILKVLPSWRTWQGGYALLDIVDRSGNDSQWRAQCFDGVGKLILGSDSTFSTNGKFELSAAALKKANTDEEREDVISGFRYSSWRELNYVSNNEVDPALKKAVEDFVKN